MALYRHAQINSNNELQKRKTEKRMAMVWGRGGGNGGLLPLQRALQSKSFRSLRGGGGDLVEKVRKRRRIQKRKY
jgi:hypothetical protein